MWVSLENFFYELFLFCFFQTQIQALFVFCLCHGTVWGDQCTGRIWRPQRTWLTGLQRSLKCVCCLQSSSCSEFLIGAEQCSCSLMFSKAFLKKAGVSCGIHSMLAKKYEWVHVLYGVKSWSILLCQDKPFGLSPAEVIEIKFCASVILVILGVFSVLFCFLNRRFPRVIR